MSKFKGMENIRPLKELLQVFLDNQDLFRTGICSWSNVLWMHGFISKEEERYIDALLEDHPDYNPVLFIWKLGLIEPRINWLKENLK